MEESKAENVINIIKDMNTKDKLRLGICLTTSDWANILYNKTEMYEKFDTMLKEVDEEYRTTLINFAKYKLVMFTMAKIMEMEQIQRIVNEFDQLLSNKNNLNQELSKVNLMYSESKKSLEKLQQMGLTETDERVKNEIAKQASYLETINEIAAKFNSTNSEIEKYDKQHKISL